MVKVSIIVPVYNVERYLRRCLDSLVNQTLQEIEIIVVNDASPDGSDSIMREYEKWYPRKVKCIYSQYNRFQGGARNIGIEKAHGEFLMFVDADDYVDITICEKLYNAAIESQYDTVYCDYYREYEDIKKRTWSSFMYDGLCGTTTLQKQLCLSVKYFFCWGQIIHRSLFSDGELRFPEQIKFEDTVFVSKHLCKTKKTGMVHEALYTYVIREGSSSHARNPGVYYDYLKAASLILDYGEKSPVADSRVIRYATAQNYLYCLKRLLEFDEISDVNIREICDEALKRIPEICTLELLCTSDIVTSMKMVQSYQDRDGCLSTWMDIVREGSKGNEYYYKSFSTEIKEILSQLRSSYKKIILWGSGARGKEFLRQFDSEQQIITWVVDQNPKLWGTALETGHIVEDYKQVALKADAVIVANRNYISSITASAKEYNETIEVVDMDTVVALRYSKCFLENL